LAGICKLKNVGEGADPKHPTVAFVVENGLIGFGNVGTPTLFGRIIG
jgi:hypothetical protein